VRTVHESPAYQAALREGRREGLHNGRLEVTRRLVLRYRTWRFGKPDDASIAAIEAIQDVDRLQLLTDRIFDATAGDWNDLLRGSSWAISLATRVLRREDFERWTNRR
jgi:hypothetical protein